MVALSKSRFSLPFPSSARSCWALPTAWSAPLSGPYNSREWHVFCDERRGRANLGKKAVTSDSYCSTVVGENKEPGACARQVCLNLGENARFLSTREPRTSKYELQLLAL